MFTVANVQNSMTIQILRSNIELISGIPYHLQRLHYIDDGLWNVSILLELLHEVQYNQISLAKIHFDAAILLPHKISTYKTN